MIPLLSQLKCAQRELALRRNVYPKWVQQGKLTREKALHEIDCMAAIVETLQKRLDLEEATKEILAKP